MTLKEENFTVEKHEFLQKQVYEIGAGEPHLVVLDRGDHTESYFAGDVHFAVRCMTAMAQYIESQYGPIPLMAALMVCTPNTTKDKT